MPKWEQSPIDWAGMKQCPDCLAEDVHALIGSGVPIWEISLRLGITPGRVAELYDYECICEELRKLNGPDYPLPEELTTLQILERVAANNSRAERSTLYQIVAFKLGAPTYVRN